MRAKSVLSLILFLALGLLVSIPQIPNAHAVVAVDTFDGNQCDAFSTSCAVTRTLSQGNDVIYVVCDSRRPAPDPQTAPTDSKGNIYNSRTVVISGSVVLHSWYAVSSGSGSITVQCNYTNGFAESMMMMAISGADTTTIFDANAAIPATNSCTSTGCPTGNLTATATTSNANDFVIITWGTDASGVGLNTCSSDFTLKESQTGNANRGGLCDNIVSATYSNRLFWGRYNVVGNMAIIVDAIMALSGSTVIQPIKCIMANTVGSTATILISAGGPTIAGIICDGSVTNISVNPSVTLTATEPITSTPLATRFEFPVSGAPSSTTIFAVCSSGTCISWVLTNYYELFVTNPLGLSLTPTQVGSPVASTLGSWTDYGANLVVTATYTNIWTVTVPSFIYDVAQGGIGIQILADQSLFNDQGVSTIKWTNGNPNQPYLTFTTLSSLTSSHIMGFIPPISGLDLQNVFNKGIVNPTATFSGNTIDETGVSQHEWDLFIVGTASPNPSPTPTPGNPPSPSPTGSQSPPASNVGGGITTLPIFQIQVTTTTATILGQPFVLVAPVYGDPGLIPLGIAVLVTSVAIIFLGAAFFSDRERKKREYDPQRHF